MDLEKYANDMISNSRYLISKLFIRGNGIEIGAGDRPLPIESNVKCIYVDKISSLEQDLYFGNSVKIETKEINALEINEFFSNQDFIIALHVLEHLEDPILFFEKAKKTLKTGGILMIAIPLREHCADFERDLTTIDHLIRDYETSGDFSRLSHCQEFYDFVVPGSEKLNHKMLGHWIEYSKFKGNEPHLKLSMVENLDLHFHVWDEGSFLDFATFIENRFNFTIVISHFTFNELIVIFESGSGA
jgi:SAM-dependent methyltransferase